MQQLQSVIYKLILLPFLLLLFTHISWAQQACFDSDFVKGCVPLTVNVTNCSSLPRDNVIYFFDFVNNPNEFSENTTFTYETEGVYIIRQLIGTANGPREFTQTIEVLNPAAPRFSLITCANRTVQVQIDGGTYDKYLVNYGDGTEETIFPSDVPTHTYAAGNSATITVKGLFDNAANNCSETTQTTNLIENLAPAQLTNLQFSGGSVQLDFNLPTDTEYMLEVKSGGSYQTVQTIGAGSSSLTLNGQSAPTCYRIKAVDACTGTEQISNELCSMEMTATSSAKINTATWSVYTGNGFVFYEVVRDGVSLGQFGNDNITTFTDEQVVCQQEYCYQVVINTNEGSSTTNQACVTTTSSTQPLSVNQFYVSVEANIGVLRWQVPNGVEASKIIVEKAEGAGSFSALAEVAGEETQFADPTIDPTVVNCYQISLVDDCGNTAAPETSCTVVVSGEKVNQDNQVNWTEFQGFADFNYIIEIYDDAGELLREEGPLTPVDIRFLDFFSNLEGNAQTYRIRVEDEQSDGISFSNFHRITDPNIIKVPDAFTPNDDGLNDTFDVVGSRITSFRIDIFNRWGTVVFGSDDMNVSWDGTLKGGKKAPKNPYTWVIKAEDESGATFNEKGTLLLLR